MTSLINMKRWLVALGLGCAMLVGSAHAQDIVTYVYTDAQGTPLAETNAAGAITATYDYTPYGTSVTNAGMSGAPNGPGYTGHVNDPDSGLVYMQARYYDPAVGRFLSTDPMVPAAGNTPTFNRFVYVNNNPIKNVDPDGKAAEEAEVRTPEEGVDPFGTPFLGPNMVGASPFRPMVGEASSEYIARRDAQFERMDSTPEKNAAEDAEGDLAAKGINPKSATGRGSVPKSERDPKRFFGPKARADKREAQGGKCGQGCGKKIDRTNSEGHHIKRHADGGRTVEENHSEVCKDCHDYIHKA